MPALVLGGLGLSEALIILLIALFVLTVWGVVIWGVVQIVRGVVQIVRPPRAGHDPSRARD